MEFPSRVSIDYTHSVLKRGMPVTWTKEQIKDAALRLEPAEREALAEELLLSVGPAERGQIDAAWLAEVRRRDAAYRDGNVAAKPVNEVIERLRKNAV
jgi:putative addiction module component (TIGR02574 family)